MLDSICHVSHGSGLLPRWLVQPCNLVQAPALASNGSFLAVLPFRASSTAPLALLSPTTKKRRIRLALPSLLAQTVTVMDEAAMKEVPDNTFLRQESLNFFLCHQGYTDPCNTIGESYSPSTASEFSVYL